MYDLDRLKHDANLVKVADALGLQPKKQGRNFVARCPAHADQGRPNLVIRPNGVKCYRCGWSADAIGLVKQVRGCETAEAIRWLADLVGLRPEDPPRGKKRPSKATKRGKPEGLGYAPGDRPEAIYPNSSTARPSPPSANTKLSASVAPDVRFAAYDALLRHTRPADVDNPSPGAVWLRDVKGISLATQSAQGIAWLEDWDGANRQLKADFGVAALIALGLINDKGDLRFKSHRLLFPFWLPVADGQLKAVYLQGRNIHADDKRGRFLNPSGDVPCPYNVDAIRAARSAGASIIIAEGVTDTLSLAQNGFFACGIVGTQGFKPDWVSLFDGLAVWLAFDPDEAGQTAALKVARVFERAGRLAPSIIPLPDGQDVTDFFTDKVSKKTVGPEEA